jgi:hypothetical protein
MNDLDKHEVLHDALPKNYRKKMKEANQQPLKMSYDTLRTYALSIDMAQDGNTGTSNPDVAKAAEGNMSSEKANNIRRKNRNHGGGKNNKSKQSILEGQERSFCGMDGHTEP